MRKPEDGTGSDALFTADATLDLHRAEAEAYAENLVSSEPAIYVVLRQNDVDDENPDPDVDVHLAEISLSPYNIQDIEDCGEDQVEKLALLGPIRDFVVAFVETHYKPEPFIKRKRDKAKTERGEGPINARKPRDGVFAAPSEKNKGPGYH